MFKKLRLIISLLLILLWGGYYVATQGFTHIHIVNSQIITHSHPYANPHHQHSSASFSLINALSTLLLIANDFSFSVAVAMIVLATLACTPAPSDFMHKCLKCSLLRAPPVC